MTYPYKEAVANIWPEIWFEFDGNLDGSGYGERGLGALSVVASGHTLSEPGLPSGGPSAYLNGGFRGRSGYYNGGHYSFAMFDTSTFAVWVKLTSTGTNTAWNFNALNALSGAGYIRCDIINGVARIRGASATNFASGGSNLNDGEWHFIVWRRTSGTGGELWIDGALADYTTANASLTENISGYLWVGDNGYTSYGDNFTGWLAHPMHWPWRLSEQNIYDLYIAGITPPSTSTPFRGWGIPV